MSRRDPRGLGRGLSALMSDIGDDAAPAAPRRPDAVVPIEQVRPNPDQPRRAFAEGALAELTASVQAKGILQPLIVRPDPEGGYQIVAGERRWRAAQRANLHEVPVIVRSLTDEEVLEIALIENIQRADLNPIEEAEGFRRLMTRYQQTQSALAEAMGKSREYVANALRLLNLPETVRDAVRTGSLSAGHARALVTVPEPHALAARVIREGLSVRQTEKLARAAKPQSPGKAQKAADIVALERELAAAIGMRVEIRHDAGSGGGQMVIGYRDLEQFDGLMRRLAGDA